MLTFSINPDIYAFKGNYTPHTQEGREWLSTMWENAINGKCDNNVDPDAYGYVCGENSMKVKVKREVQIVTVEEKEDGAKGIAESVLKYFDDGLEDILNKEEIRENLRIFEKLSKELIKEKRINLCMCVLLALKGDKRAIVNLKDLMQDSDCTYILKKVIRNVRGLNINGDDTIEVTRQKQSIFEIENKITFSQFLKDIISIRNVGGCIERMI